MLSDSAAWPRRPGQGARAAAAGAVPAVSCPGAVRTRVPHGFGPLGPDRCRQGAAGKWRRAGPQVCLCVGGRLLGAPLGRKSAGPAPRPRAKAAGLKSSGGEMSADGFWAPVIVRRVRCGDPGKGLPVGKS